VEMPEDSYLEIDEPSDWIAIEQALKKRLEKTGDAELPWDRIRMFLTDCDGCLTDGGMYYSENGDELKKFNTKDGMGLRLLREHGILTGIITAETRELNRRRAEKLKLDEYQEGVQDKASSIRALCEKHGIDPAEVAYLGDDLGDLEAVRMAGIGCCVADGVAAVRESADYITIARGGAGAVRELADRILAGRL
ncbi:MAG: HAD-IIIA family hydrolase, partial [Lachnospiraceae bacterium]|nr:HAD-IIIA family hydrolase [Lachnospiraceae bacterium]